MSDAFWFLLLGFVTIGVLMLALTWPWIVEWYLGGPWKFDFE